MKTESWKAWAIDKNYTDIDGKKCHGFIGRYWYFPKQPNPGQHLVGDLGPGTCQIPSHLEGCMIALFNTRREAREALKSVRRAFRRARVMRVYVDIEPVGN